MLTFLPIEAPPTSAPYGKNPVGAPFRVDGTRVVATIDDGDGAGTRVVVEPEEAPEGLDDDALEAAGYVLDDTWGWVGFFPNEERAAVVARFSAALAPEMTSAAVSALLPYAGR